ncbi:MAG: hypothetical protein A3E01_14810 [Gammaproteobacteria bacterium RIFCSPHIGHO2_12_FULL_63_22]|nr:MAG: hypothetical protein A3E01_14810 [Gammaproteobacteria bacterium RIFCSPHIGHO2_12_FULL_63_22]
MTCGLGIMVKTPDLSPVKTRLAADVGCLRAEAFYLCSAEAVASVALQVPATQLTTYWAVAERRALIGPSWADLPRMDQGEGGLGERMSHVYRTLRGEHRLALLLGADAPQLTCDMLRRAIDWLSLPGPRLVIGPARDGGFWMFGGNCELPDQAWTQPTYSQARTRGEFVSAMQGCGEWLEIDELSDVDRGADLAVVTLSLQQLPSPTEAQRRLAGWLEDWMSLKAATP